MEPDRLTPPAPGAPVLHPPRVDILTTAAVAVVVYTFSSILHEALGHGLTCVLLGGKVACSALETSFLTFVLTLAGFRLARSSANG